VPFARGPVLRYIGAGQYATVGTTEYVGERDVIHIPSDFHTDLASIPRVFWSLMPPCGVYEQAAVAHDWLCTEGIRSGFVTSRDADGIFRRIAREGGTGFVARWILWCGVRYGALVNPIRRPGVVRDLPLMAVITAATLTATAGVLYGLDRAAHALLALT
jgi:hypothetical protein